MRSPDYWRSQWAVAPLDIDLAAENEKREKTGFVSIISWPLTLLILQASVFAPLFGSGFLGSPFDDGTDGATIAPTAQNPNPLDPNLPVDPGSVNGGTPLSPDGSGTPTGAAPIPENATITLTPESGTGVSSASTGIDKAHLFPGQAFNYLAAVNNTGNVPLGTLQVKVTSSNPLFADPNQGLTLNSWSCPTAWSGTPAKPVCNGTVTKGNPIKLSAGQGDSNILAAAPGQSQHLLFSFALPSSADDRFQKATTDLNITISAQQTGEVAGQAATTGATQ